jgi:hypothetical protein
MIEQNGKTDGQQRLATAGHHTAAPCCTARRAPFLGVFPRLGYNLGFDFNYKTLPQTMEAERINALSALLNDLTSREAELRRYL